MNRAISRGRGRRGRRERRGRLIRNEFEVTSTGIIGGQESWNYSTEGEGEKIGTIPGGISPFDFVYSSFIGGIIGLICNLDSSSALSSSTGSILVQGRGGKRGRRSNFQRLTQHPAIGVLTNGRVDCRYNNERRKLRLIIIHIRDIEFYFSD